jgi:predicted ATPase
MVTCHVVDEGDQVVSPNNEPVILLVRDKWNDHGYLTSFWLRALLPGHGGTIDIGTVKILHQDQRSGRTPLPDVFTQLGPDYCSLGQSLSYYESLHQLGVAIRDAVLLALRDVVADESIADQFSDLEGFKKSLERTGSAMRAIHDARPLLSDSSAPPAMSTTLALPFRTGVGGQRFTVPFSFNDIPELPGRMNVVIGYNGTGKTRLLANLAMVASEEPQERRSHDLIQQAGEFVEDPRFPFGAVITVSYSAFDTFDIPGTGRTRDAAERVRKSGELFGYVYCGLRSFQQDSAVASDRLKSPSELRQDTLRAWKDASVHRRALMNAALAPLLLEPSFLRANLSLDPVNESRIQESFDRLSTGHKIVLNIVFQLVAHLQLKSLVLFDEPECHLHPPLLAALLRSIAVVLDDRDSYAVIATHSPVVLQEIPARYVHILERFGHMTRVRRPDQETFAENLGYLTKTVFNLDSRATDYHATLEALAADRTPEQVEDLFGGQMSGQGRAYVESLHRARR